VTLEDWSNDAENSALHHRNKLLFKNIYSPQSGHGVYKAPIDFYLIKKKVPCFISVE